MGVVELGLQVGHLALPLVDRLVEYALALLGLAGDGVGLDGTRGTGSRCSAQCACAERRFRLCTVGGVPFVQSVSVTLCRRYQSSYVVGVHSNDAMLPGRNELINASPYIDADVCDFIDVRCKHSGIFYF